MKGRSGNLRGAVILSGMFLTVLVLTSSNFGVAATTTGWWDKYTYTQTIPVGMFYYHQHQHNGALYGSARIVSTTGKAVLAYQWSEPWLFVTITNKDTVPITVTWEEKFYVT